MDTGGKLDKWLKIENIINGFLSKIAQIFSGAVKKATPKKIGHAIEQGSSKVSSKANLLKKKISSAKGSVSKKASNTIQGIQLKKKTAQDKVSKASAKIKGIDWKSLTIPIVLSTISLFAKPILGKISSWYLSFKPVHIVSFIASGTLGMLITVNIYNSAKKIAEKAKQTQGREPASIQKKGKGATDLVRRPNYYNKNEREVHFKNVKMPVYIGKKAGFHYLVIDFTFIPSNKYIKAYFLERPFLVEDKLNSAVQPIIPTFPLEEEGKVILMDKIQEELNILVKELKIDGSIDEVYLNKIIAG